MKHLVLFGHPGGCEVFNRHGVGSCKDGLAKMSEICKIKLWKQKLPFGILDKK
jgi:hypothetical protein